MAAAVAITAPASAEASIPPGYVLKSREWCNWDNHSGGTEVLLGDGPARLIIKLRNDNWVCAYVNDNASGAHQMRVTGLKYGWTTPAYDQGVFDVYAGAVATYNGCLRAWGTATIGGQTEYADSYFYFCSWGVS